MAALSERELKDKASAYLSRGALEPALEAFKALICMNGREPLYRLRHAEVCARLKRVEAAVASYRVAAHLFSSTGRVPQARAALNVAMKLAPRDMSVRRAMAGLFEPTPSTPVPRVSRVSLAAAAEAITEPCLLPMFE